MIKQRFTPLVVIMLAVLAGSASCASNRRIAPAADMTYKPLPTTAELSKGWSIQFCPDETIDDNVSVEIGRADDESSRRIWRAFNPRTDPTFLLPEDLRFVDKLWIKMTSENHREVEACVKYDGNATQKLLFQDSAEESIDRTHTEDCGC